MRPLNIKEYKQTLRKSCREKRENLPLDVKKEADSKIAVNIRRLKEYPVSKTILIYMSTPIEVDTTEIIKNAWADGKRVAVPRCIPNTRDMEFHYIESLEELSPGSFSVLEPSESNPIVTDFSGCLMIVPGMRFDMNGYRIGYGKGYYDRYMVRFEGISVGICYADELRPFMYHGKYDRAVNIVLTDKKIKTCKRQEI